MVVRAEARLEAIFFFLTKIQNSVSKQNSTGYENMMRSSWVSAPECKTGILTRVLPVRKW